MGKILFLSNIDRRIAMMDKAINLLKVEKSLKVECESVKVSNESLWSRKWEKELLNSDVLILKWMGTGLDTEFLRRLMDFMKVNKIDHFSLLAADEEKCEQVGFSTEEEDTFNRYM